MELRLAQKSQQKSRSCRLFSKLCVEYNVGKAITYRISSKTGGKGDNIFTNRLRKYNVLNNKHIPDCYKYNSRDVQLKVLAGIIDSDEYCSKSIGYDICLILENLIDDIMFICKSLEYTVSKAQCQKTCTNGRNGPVIGTYYRIYINSNYFSDIPLLLEYKKAKQRKKSCNRSFKVKKSTSERNGIKLELDGDGRFLLKDFVVASC